MNKKLVLQARQTVCKTTRKNVKMVGSPKVRQTVNEDRLSYLGS
jgi:hypothetical protein